MEGSFVEEVDGVANEIVGEVVATVSEVGWGREKRENLRIAMEEDL
jgi:hypothetical protein